MYAMNVMNTLILSCHFLVQRFYYNLVFIHVTFARLLNLLGYGSSVPVENDVTDHVALLVNNLGGLSQLELGGVVAEVRRALDKPGIQIMRLLSVFFMVCSVCGLCLLGLMMTLPLLDTSPYARIYNHHASAPCRKRHGNSLR
jgi:hypothetical protein